MRILCEKGFANGFQMLKSLVECSTYSTSVRHPTLIVWTHEGRYGLYRVPVEFVLVSVCFFSFSFQHPVFIIPPVHLPPV